MPDKIEQVDHPAHYGGKSNPNEAIKVIEANGWGPEFCYGNAIKYILRADKKPDAIGGGEVQDLKKAIWYLERRIQQIQRTIPDDTPRTSPPFTAKMTPDQVQHQMREAFGLRLSDTSELYYAVGNVYPKRSVYVREGATNFMRKASLHLADVKTVESGWIMFKTAETEQRTKMEEIALVITGQS